jgi:uncharacterized protein (DUF1697 family)
MNKSPDDPTLKRFTPWIALLRGINVGGHNKIPMAELRSLAIQIGLNQVRTYIQSGNLVFAAVDPASVIELQLEQAIERHFGIQIPVIVRAAADWSAYAKGNPFPDAALSEPNLLMLALSKTSLGSGAASALQERAANGERIVQVGDALWIHFPNGVGKSRLTPALLDRLTGSSVTLRNWLTVVKLRELCELEAP